MIGTIRLFWAATVILAASATLAPLQWLAMKTRLAPEPWFRTAWHRAVLKALGIRVHRLGELSDRRPLLVASNHVSWTDIGVIGSQVDVSFVAKAEVGRWPLVGQMARLQRTIFVEREARRKSGEQAGEIGRRLAAGDAVLLFPEGTTADGNMPIAFKSTLFGAASAALAGGAGDRVYIQPLAIAYTRIHGLPLGRQHRPIASWIGSAGLVPHFKQLAKEGAIDVELHFGEPVEFVADGDRKRLTREVEARVKALMQASLGDPQ
jgi:1-acyl-sn-glycerol-3-phosphate acyltransferase